MLRKKIGVPSRVAESELESPESEVLAGVGVRVGI